MYDFLRFQEQMGLSSFKNLDLTDWLWIQSETQKDREISIVLVLLSEEKKAIQNLSKEEMSKNFNLPIS